eukprot:jgi/Botrbrau1/124/Bobra.0022s0110.1
MSLSTVLTNSFNTVELQGYGPSSYGYGPSQGGEVLQLSPADLARYLSLIVQPPARTTPLEIFTVSINNKLYLQRLNVRRYMVKELLPLVIGRAGNPIGSAGDPMDVPLTDKNETIFKHNIYLRDDDGKTWEVLYEYYIKNLKRHLEFRKGWRAFTKHRGVVVGDSVVFERWGENRFELKIRVKKGVENADQPAEGKKRSAKGKEREAQTPPQSEEEEEEEELAEEGSQNPENSKKKRRRVVKVQEACPESY